MTGGDTNHYTTEEPLDAIAKQRLHSASGQVKATSMFSRLAQRTITEEKGDNIFVISNYLPFDSYNIYSRFLVPIQNVWINARLFALPVISQFYFDQVELTYVPVVSL